MENPGTCAIIAIMRFASPALREQDHVLPLPALIFPGREGHLHLLFRQLL